MKTYRYLCVIIIWVKPVYSNKPIKKRGAQPVNALVEGGVLEQQKLVKLVSRSVISRASAWTKSARRLTLRRNACWKCRQAARPPTLRPWTYGAGRAGLLSRPRSPFSWWRASSPTSPESSKSSPRRNSSMGPPRWRRSSWSPCPPSSEAPAERRLARRPPTQPLRTKRVTDARSPSAPRLTERVPTSRPTYAHTQVSPRGLRGFWKPLEGCIALHEIGGVPRLPRTSARQGFGLGAWQPATHCRYERGCGPSCWTSTLL